MKKKIKSYRIQIPEPCNEGWQNMTPQEKGRHCKTCDKVVVDFSAMSDNQIIRYLEEKKQQNQRVCGHFRSNQIDRSMIHSTPYRSQTSGFLIIATLLSGLTFISCNAQNTNHHKVGKVAIHQEDIVANKEDSTLQKFLIVSNIDGKPIKNAKITLNESVYSEKSWRTDDSGMVSIDWLNNVKEMTGTVSHNDYEFYTFKVQKGENKLLTIKLQYPILIDGMVEGDIEFIEEEPPKKK